eukprot:1160200-Pelagomonas_calceolata.AAC.5
MGTWNSPCMGTWYSPCLGTWNSPRMGTWNNQCMYTRAVNAWAHGAAASTVLSTVQLQQQKNKPLAHASLHSCTSQPPPHPPPAYIYIIPRETSHTATPHTPASPTLLHCPIFRSVSDRANGADASKEQPAFEMAQPCRGWCTAGSSDTMVHRMVHSRMIDRMDGAQQAPHRAASIQDGGALPRTGHSRQMADTFAVVRCNHK